MNQWAEKFAPIAGEVMPDAAALPEADLQPHIQQIATLSAGLAYQTARAEYFRYAPEIEFDPEGVVRLRAEMRKLRPE
ncbi:hypothetical protein [Arthrobacter sp. UYCu723]